MEIHGAWRKPSKQKVCTENLSLQDQQVAGLTFTPFTWGIPVSTGAGKPPWHFLFRLALKLRWFQVPDFSGNWILWVNFCPQLPFQMLIGKQFDWFAPSFRAWQKASLSGGGVFPTVPPLGMVSFGWVGRWRGTVHRSSPAALCTALLVKRCGSRRQRYQCCRAPPNCFGAEKLVWSREAGSVTGPAMLSEGGYCFVTGIALPGLWL